MQQDPDPLATSIVIEDLNAQEAPVEPGLPPGAEDSGRLESLERELAEAREQLKRVAAEFENFRRRQEAERERRQEFYREELIRSFLPVVDHLERASGAARGGGDLPSLLQGIEMVLKDTRKILEGHGVCAIEAQGRPFDPGFHEAVLTEESEEVPEDTVLAELQRGYRLGERVLRPSMVKVARRA